MKEKRSASLIRLEPVRVTSSRFKLSWRSNSTKHNNEIHVRHFVVQTNAAPGNPGGRATLDLIRMLVKGIEPPAYALRVRCSTPELHQQVIFANRNYYNSFCEYCKPNLMGMAWYSNKRLAYPGELQLLAHRTQLLL